MIPVGAFLSGVKAIMDSRPTYELGQDGRAGKCDCIGLIIGAIRRAGGEWRGAHGSNWAARNAMVSMTEHPRLEPGAVMYKAHDPGGRGYALPDTYKAHPDQRDYYHVGVVLSASPLRIAHCTSWGGGSGIKVDTAIGRWKYGGRPKGINFDKDEVAAKVEKWATVRAPNGGTVNLRNFPAVRDDNVLAKPRTGTKVAVLDDSGNWWQINAEGITGWMMSEFLVPDGAKSPAPAVDVAALVAEIEGNAQRILTMCKALKGAG